MAAVNHISGFHKVLNGCGNVKIVIWISGSCTYKYKFGGFQEAEHHTAGFSFANIWGHKFKAYINLVMLISLEELGQIAQRTLT